ncbi:Beta-galactosidase [Lunatimonas lonarensis]|uniref:Beta-galactosidase n=2 Tax=Lunatimonas lonarensis TaxID=1232681 RepID=R7ZWD0_9BACT|nr:Beta-galactosidase [Lunatimonas lonarensis]
MLLAAGCRQSADRFTETMDLSGEWRFELDRDGKGMEEEWFSRDLSDKVQLPGTTDENQKGDFIDERAEDRLSRVWYWKGAAWYQREIDIPDSWQGKRVQLFLERTKDTHVWLNGTYCGYENTLSAPQYFEMTKAVVPGKNVVTVLVDNAKLPPVGPSHAVDERTQTNWNGIVGKMELQATDPVWVDGVQAYPDVENNRVRLRIKIGNLTQSDASGKITLQAETWNTEKTIHFEKHVEQVQQLSQGESDVFVDFGFDKQAPLWDEFDPALIRVMVALETESGDDRYQHATWVDFGMREFKREGKFLMNNGNRVFLRGRIDCANFPLTGYAPMDRESWLEMFRTLKSYGINHWRFHSWFPPKEALTAADMVGVYLQPELPNKRSGMDQRSMEQEEVRKIYNVDYLELEGSKINLTLKEYLEKEADLIFRHFGNHPSFTLFTLGNELGRNQAMYDLVATFKADDPRRLYAQGSNNMHWEPSFAEGDDFWVIGATADSLPVRGSFAYISKNAPFGHINEQSPSTLVNFAPSIAHVEVPVIGHETGQFQVSPDFNEIPKYTGVTRARNYELFQERLEKANMLDQADDFVKASGKLAVICYREDIEAALRTPDFGGFQLLDIMDFPGQGTAPVGILNVFMQSKGLVTPEEWRQFCSEVVPLLKMEKYTWTNKETFEASLDVAHYGPRDLVNTKINWQLSDLSGKVLAEGSQNAGTISRGALQEIGEIRIPLAEVKGPQQVKVSVAIADTPYKNTYDLWIYPDEIDTSVPSDMMVSRRLDESTKHHLEKGGKAILFPELDRLPKSIEGAFITDFWSWPMFARGAANRGVDPAPGSLGFLCAPESPLFNHFPTDFHSNWQWWHLVKNSRPIILDETSADYRPLIQTIDNFGRNHKLGTVFETSYGSGSLLVCAIDLPNLMDLPEARQLYYSMLKYVESDQFSPVFEIDRAVLRRLVP